MVFKKNKNTWNSGLLSDFWKIDNFWFYGFVFLWLLVTFYYGFGLFLIFSPLAAAKIRNLIFWSDNLVISFSRNGILFSVEWEKKGNRVFKNIFLCYGLLHILLVYLFVSSKQLRKYIKTTNKKRSVELEHYQTGGSSFPLIIA